MRNLLLASAMIGLSVSAQAQTLPCNGIPTETLLGYVDTMFQRGSQGQVMVFDVVGDIIGPNDRNECTAHLMTNKGEVAFTYNRHSVNGNAYIKSLGTIDWDEYTRKHQ